MTALVNHDARPQRIMSRRHRAIAVGLTAALLLIVSVVMSVGSGALQIPLGVTLRAITQGIVGQDPALRGLELIVWNLRFPRVLSAVVVGASLGASGAAMQGLLRNPLADPYLLGIASGASLGATVASLIGGRLGAAFAEMPFASMGLSNLVPLFAFAGAVAATLITVLLAGMGPRSREASLLLSGVVVGSILMSLTTYLMLRDADRIRAVFSWTLGNLSIAGWPGLSKAVPYAAIGFAILMAHARSLDALQLGDDTAQTLGVSVNRVRFGVIAGASLATAAAVAFVGLIGFVGLVAPHMMRRLATPDHRSLLINSALGGAVLLVLSDLGARTWVRPAELPVGIVTTLLGGPFFLWLLRRDK